MSERPEPTQIVIKTTKSIEEVGKEIAKLNEKWEYRNEQIMFKYEKFYRGYAIGYALFGGATTSLLIQGVWPWVAGAGLAILTGFNRWELPVWFIRLKKRDKSTVVLIDELSAIIGPLTLTWSKR